MTYLESDERIDYLPNGNVKIIQSPEVFSFSMDAVLLARFCYVPIKKGKIVDLCSGNGAIPLLLSERSKATMIGVELQERLYNMAVRSTELNQLEGQLKFINDDITKVHKQLEHGQFDVVTCNPPYFKNVTEKEWNENKHYAIARHEIYCNLKDVIKACSILVKQKGKVAIVHRPERLIEIISYMKEFMIEPKRIQFVYPRVGKEANILLIEGVMRGSPGVKIHEPLFVYDVNDQYTEPFKKVFYEKYKL